MRNSKQRVLFLIESLAGGGAEKVLATLVRHLDKSKFDVTVCVVSGSGKYEEEVKKCCSYKALLTTPSDFLSKLLYLVKHHLIYKWLPMWLVYKMFIPKGNDVEVAFVEGYATKLLSFSCNKHARKYTWVHTDLSKNHWTDNVYRDREEEACCYGRYDRVLGVSNTVCAAFQKEFPLVTVPVVTMYNVIDSEEILSKSQEPLEKKEKHGIRLVTAGRLEFQKGYTRLLRIVDRLLHEGCDMELWILGDGSERAVLEQYIEEHHLQERVSLLGFQPNPYKYLATGDLFVCSSLAEGYSTVVTEALILGLPVVTTDCSGMSELLKDGECGMITENSEESLYEGLRTVLSDSEMFFRYKRKAVERGKDFEMKRLMSSVEKLLER